jgi:hypothetical protein
MRAADLRHAAPFFAIALVLALIAAVPALSSRARQAFAAATPAYTSCPAPIGAETLVIMVTPRDRTPARCIYVDGRNASRTRAARY